MMDIGAQTSFRSAQLLLQSLKPFPLARTFIHSHRKWIPAGGCVQREFMRLDAGRQSCGEERDTRLTGRMQGDKVVLLEYRYR